MREHPGSSKDVEVARNSFFAVHDAGTHARFDPATGGGTIDHALHLARYQWLIENHCHPGELVVDLGCGNGYGSLMIHQHGCHVVGIDLDPGVEAKNAGGSTPNLRFVCADATLPRLDERIGVSGADVVAAMETIEHLEDYFTFIENCIRLLHPGGTVVIGTPNRTMTYERYPGRRHMDSSHVQEFTPLALRITLQHYFKSVDLYFEYLPGYWPQSTKRPQDGPQPKTRRPLHRALRSLIPPIFISMARTLRRRWSRLPVTESRSFYAASDVMITSSTSNQLERDAFAVVAVCRTPRGQQV
jgi:2-polyprenyl-3-methyl-5-hydroxy-6-metoxy-1,4-benzoquinol methylase